MVRTLARVTAIAALALPMAFVAAEPAAAAVVQTCGHVNGTATFTPGLTNTPTDNVVKAKGSETTCTPSASTGGKGTLTATLKVPQGSCTKLGAGGQTVYGTGNTKWANGKVSNYNLALITGTGANATLANVKGKVTSGLFSGKSLTGQIRFKVNGSPTCTAANPVKSVTFANTKAFVTS